MLRNKSAARRELNKQTARRDQQNILKSASARLDVSVANKQRSKQ
jgi:hypothetical protein